MPHNCKQRVRHVQSGRARAGHMYSSRGARGTPLAVSNARSLLITSTNLPQATAPPGLPAAHELPWGRARAVEGRCTIPVSRATQAPRFAVGGRPCRIGGDPPPPLLLLPSTLPSPPYAAPSTSQPRSSRWPRAIPPPCAPPASLPRPTGAGTSRLLTSHIRGCYPTTTTTTSAEHHSPSSHQPSGQLATSSRQA